MAGGVIGKYFLALVVISVALCGCGATHEANKKPTGSSTAVSSRCLYEEQALRKFGSLSASSPQVYNAKAVQVTDQAIGVLRSLSEQNGSLATTVTDLIKDLKSVMNLAQGDNVSRLRQVLEDYMSKSTSLADSIRKAC